MFNKVKELFFSLTAKNIYLITGGNILVIICGFIFTVLSARSLSPSDFGIFSVAISLIVILADLGELGIGGGLVNFLPSFIKSKDILNTNKIIKTTYLLQIIISLLISLVLIIFSTQIAQLLFRSSTSLYLIIIRLSTIGVIAFMLFNFVNSILSAKEEFNKIFLLQILYTLPRLFILFLFIYFLKVSLVLVVIVFLLGPLIPYLISIFLIPINLIKLFKIKGFFKLSKIFKFSLYLAVNKLFVSLFSRLDVLMLSAMISSHEVGIYSAASRIAFIYPLIGGSIGTVFAPKYAKFDVPAAISFTKKALLLMFLLISSIIVLIILSPIIIPLVFGSQYLESINIMQILLITMIPFLIAIPINNLLIYTFKKPQIIAFSSLTQLLVILVLNLLLIPKIGRYAPAISNGIASSLSMVISIVSAYILFSKK